MSSSHLILCHPLLLLSPIPPTIRIFSNESTLCMRWPKYWSFRFSIIPFKEHPGLIFIMDWLDLLAVQGVLKTLLQHHSSKASILRHSAFFGLPRWLSCKESTCNAGDPGSIPGSGRSPGKGNGNPLQDSCLENPMDRGAWWATVHGVSKSRTRLKQLGTHTHMPN